MKVYPSRSPKWLFTIVLLMIISLTHGKPKLEDLVLKDTGKKIENTIDIFTSESEYQKVKNVDGQKVTLKKSHIIINGDSLGVEEIQTHGKSTLFYRRKSFKFSLDSKADFFHGNNNNSTKKFNAISLSMDKYYFRNRLAFELLNEIELFGLYYAYSELKINGHTEGIYLITERPQDWALKRENSPLLIRRGYDQKIDKIKTGKKIEKPEAKNYKNYYTQIYRSLNKHDGQELYDVLSTWIDLEMYMKWLAFNFFIRNGDYTDEVFLCIDPDENRFKIIPWDYDDIFADAPHEGNVEKKKKIGDKYIFSSEDRLDQKIAKDSFLYEKYLIQLKQVLLQLTPEVLQNSFQNTYSELYPFFTNQNIISMSQFDAYKNANINKLETEMNTIYNHLIISRNLYLNDLIK